MSFKLCDLWFSWKYSGVLERDLEVDFEGSKVGFGVVFFFFFVTKLHEMTGNDQKSAWEHHLGVGTINFGDLGCPGRYSGVLERDFDVDSEDSKVGYGVEY